MAVKIRLTRLGDKHSPFYRVVVADSRVARDGGYIAALGTYNPLTNPAEVKIDLEAAAKWIKNGALPTETAKTVLVQAGYKFEPKAKKAKKATAKTAAKAPAKKAASTAKKPAAKKTEA